MPQHTEVAPSPNCPPQGKRVTQATKIHDERDAIMSKPTKKGGLLGRLLGPDKSESGCCSVQIVEEPEEAQQTAPAADKAGGSCCAPEAQQAAPPEEARR